MSAATIGAAAAGLGWLQTARGTAPSRPTIRRWRSASRGIAGPNRAAASARCSAGRDGERLHGPERRPGRRRPADRRGERHRRADRRGAAADPSRSARAGSPCRASIRLQASLSGGDDYELLFAVPRAARAAGSAVAPAGARRADSPASASSPKSAAWSSSATAPANRCRPASSTSDAMAGSCPHPLAGSNSCCTPTTRRSARRPRMRSACSSGFSPMLGLHTVLGLALAFVFSLNRVAVMLGVYSNLPWILPAYYTLATIAGAAVLGVESAAGARRGRAGDFSAGQSWGEFRRPCPARSAPSWAFVLGSTIGSVLLARYRVPGVARHDSRPSQASLLSEPTKLADSRAISRYTPGQFEAGTPLTGAAWPRYSGPRPPSASPN